jgi:ABC-type phosphate transport system auxiliary subunit
VTWFFAFLSSFTHVSLRSFQQKNVQTDSPWWWILPTSLFMGLTEVCGVLLIVQSESFLIFLPLGFGGAAGCLAAMSIHKRLRDVPKSRHNPTRMANPRGIENDLCNEWR